LAPIFRVEDVDVAAVWYGRLDFVLEGVHRFEEGLPRYAYLRRGDGWLHLSEHRGDAPPASVAYLYVDDVDTIAASFGATVKDQPWGRDMELVDPDGNRLRVGTRAS